MNRVENTHVPPWGELAAEGFRLGSGTDPLLIVGIPGSLQIECAREIHSNAGGGPFELVICTPDSVGLRTQLFGTTTGVLSEFDVFDLALPLGAIQRAAGGTLFLEAIDRCHPDDSDWLRDLFTGSRVTIDEYSVELDSNTRVIASITAEWIDQFEYQVPQWVMLLSENRVLVMEPLGDRPEDVLGVAAWFAAHGYNARLPLTSSSMQMLASREWPGDLQELRDVVRSLVSVGAGETVTSEVYKEVLAKHQSPGMTPVDSHRRQQCSTYSQRLWYMGRRINAKEVHQWVSQFSRVSRDKGIDPWVVGLTIVKEIANRYYYSADRLRTLIRKAYLSLCFELATNGYLPNWTPSMSEDSLPSLQAVLVNPLGPLKSASGVMPHIAHLLGHGQNQVLASIEDVADQLAMNRSTRLIIFCDDFAGTGHQITTELIQSFIANEELQHICEKRRKDGSPVVLGVVLGAGFDVAVDNIRGSGADWLPVMVHTGDRLDDRDRAFSEVSLVFPDPEVRDIVSSLVVDLVGKHLSPRWPGGFGDSQALVVTGDNVPNNTLPAICRSGSVQGVPWQSLFERASTPR